MESALSPAVTFPSASPGPSRSGTDEQRPPQKKSDGPWGKEKPRISSCPLQRLHAGLVKRSG